MKLPPTEFALAPDGTIFVNARGWSAEMRRDRRIFRGSSLKRDEVYDLLSQPIDALSGVVLGCDGSVYADETHVSRSNKHGRRIFLGASFSTMERRRAIDELTRLAFNITISVLGSRNVKLPLDPSSMKEDE